MTEGEETGEIAGARPHAPAERRLAALAAEGRDRQARALAAEQEEARRIERRERREAELLGRGYVRAALLDSPRGPAPPLLPMAVVSVLAGTLLLMIAGNGGLSSGLGSTLGLGLLAFGICGFFAGRWLAGVKLVRVERRWLRGLPFPVRGYFRVLGGAPAEERQVRLRIRFRESAPERKVLEGIVGRVQQPASARLTGGSGLSWTAESGPIRTLIIDDMAPTNASTLWWMRAVIDETLLPLHDAYPLRSVRFDG